MWQVIARIGTVLIVALVAGVAELTRQHAPAPVQAAETAQEAPGAAQAFDPTNDREAWAVAFLGALGNVRPTPETVAMVVEWTLAEDSGGGAFARNNSLNTTQPGFSENATINGDGVKGYADWQSGLDAAVHTVTNGLYGDVVAALQANDAEGAKRALWASPWAGSHYGYGASWPQYQIAQQTVPAPASDPIRQQLVEMALSQMGKEYSLGANGPDQFDCSGLMQWTYAQFGMDISRTTFTQLEAPQLRAISPEQIQTGDLIYFQFPKDQHVGMLADLDGDGRWDMVQSGGTRSDVNTVIDVLNDPTYNQNIIGLRTAF